MGLANRGTRIGTSLAQQEMRGPQLVGKQGGRQGITARGKQGRFLVSALRSLVVVCIVVCLVVAHSCDSHIHGGYIEFKLGLGTFVVWLPGDRSRSCVAA